MTAAERQHFWGVTHSSSTNTWKKGTVSKIDQVTIYHSTPFTKTYWDASWEESDKLISYANTMLPVSEFGFDKKQHRLNTQDEISGQGN